MEVQGKGGKRVSAGAGRIGEMQSCGIGESCSGRSACVRIKIVQEAAKWRAEKWQKAAKEPEKSKGEHRERDFKRTKTKGKGQKKALPLFS